MGVVGPEGGRPRIIPSEGIAINKSGWVSPAGDRIAYVGKDRRVRIASIEGGPGSAVPGDPLDGVDDLVGWGADGRSVFVSREGEVPLRIDRLELSSGRRELWRRLAPEGTPFVIQIHPVAIAPDGQSYAYSYVRAFVDDLYVVDGVKGRDP